MPVSPKNALKRTEKALDGVFSGVEFVIEPVSLGTDPKDWIVFRAKRRGMTDSYICKTGAANATVREKLAQHATAQRQTLGRLPVGPHKVPEIIVFDEENVCFIQEDAKGRSLSSVLRSEDEPKALSALTKVGLWLKVFHSTTAAFGQFDPFGHLNWLKGLDFTNVLDPNLRDCAFDALGHRAEASDGKNYCHAVTHRDAHSGQFLLRGNGDVYGIDLQFTDSDIALRDIYHLFLNATYRHWDGRALPSEAIFQAIQEGYGSFDTDPAVEQFWTLFMRMKQIQEYATAQGGTQIRSRLDAMIVGLETELNA